MFALSTSWNFQTQPDIKKMLRAIKDLGFNAIEIGHHFSEQRVEDIIRLVDILKIKVVSIHNFCPLPPQPQVKRGSSDYYRLSSLDEKERRKAVKYTKRTIDTAQRLSVKAIVIHGGTVELQKNYGHIILQSLITDKINFKEYLRLKQRLLEKREREKERHLEAVTESFKEILPYAQKAKVNIGLETRYYPEEIPSLYEIRHFLKLFNNERLFYWHDVGHAEVNERLGIMPHLAFLEEFSNHMLGIHLHDIRGLEDHNAPFTGDFNFYKISHYLKDDLIKVIEVNSQSTSWQLKIALKKLQQMCKIASGYDF